MKAILIDTDILIEVSRARDAAILANWDDLSRSDLLLLCSPVTVAEIWQGAWKREHSALNALFAVLTCVPIDAQIGRRAGEAVAHALVRAVSRLLSTLGGAHGLPGPGVGTSADAARTSACATSSAGRAKQSFHQDP